MPNLFPLEITDFNVRSIEDEDDTEELEYEGSYLFNFEKGEYVKNPDGTIIKCDDKKAYEQWCNKALNTPRYKYAYSDLYGQEFSGLIGSGISKEAVELEIQRITIETLMVHPRTREVTSFSFEWSSNQDEVYYEFEVSTIDDENFTFENTMKVG